MLITPRRMATKIERPTLVIGDHAVTPSPFVRNLGVILDSVAAMQRQINAVCKTSYMNLCNISKIRCYLDKQSLACVIHAFVTCRLDYGNALLCGYPGTQIQKLQRVQNVAARLISGRRKYDYITPVLKNLHWLPIIQRIHFKVMITVFKAMHNTAPAYLQELRAQPAVCAIHTIDLGRQQSIQHRRPHTLECPATVSAGHFRHSQI